MIWSLFTIAVFLIARKLGQILNHPVANPFVICLGLIIPTLVLFNVSYVDDYYPDTDWMTELLAPAVVTLAYPLYRQLTLIKKHWKLIILGCGIASCLSMFFSAMFALFMDLDPVLTASLMGKSVTNPIAIEIAQILNGNPSITAVMVLCSGVFGAMCAYPIYQRLNITHPIARGLTMGAMSHAIGTAACLEKNYEQDVAFSSLALVSCGIITPLLAPSILSFSQWLINAI